jgi:hypothetical protein
VRLINSGGPIVIYLKRTTYILAISELPAQMALLSAKIQFPAKVSKHAASAQAIVAFKYRLPIT